MTLEEIRTEAKKHGYKLIKDTPYVRLAPCVCGHKGHGQYADWSNKKAPHYLKCYRCGFASEPAKTKYEAKIKWNECVENAKKEENNEPT